MLSCAHGMFLVGLQDDTVLLETSSGKLISSAGIQKQLWMRATTHSNAIDSFLISCNNHNILALGLGTCK